MEGGLAQCILADAPNAWRRGNFELAFEELTLLAPSGSAISARRVSGLRLRQSAVLAGPFPSATPPAATAGLAAVFLQGEDLLVERNFISAYTLAQASQRALGGVHIGGGSERIVLLRNVIAGGNGNGVTLGSVRMISVPASQHGANNLRSTAGAMAQQHDAINRFDIGIDHAGCVVVHPQDPDPTPNPDGTIQQPVSDGAVTDTRIEKNRILDMGGNGIATYPMYATLASGDAALDAVAVEQLLVLDNSITQCMQLETPQIPAIQFLFTGFGGIALTMATDCTIRDNQIAEIGAGRQQGVCGIFIGYGEDLRIERNRIESIGSALRAGDSPAPSGGIFVRFALGGISSRSDMEERRTHDRPALFVQNNIVHAPYGRALRATALGPVMVTDNRLTGANPSLFLARPELALLILAIGGGSVHDVLEDPAANFDLGNLVMLNWLMEVLGGDAVNLVNVGIAEENLLLYRAYGIANSTRSTVSNDGRDFLVGIRQTTPSPERLRGGETMFANNQVSLRAFALDEPGTDGSNRNGTISSVLIHTGDDLCFADNQLEIEGDLLFAFTDAWLFAKTVRASSNRMQEAALCLLSMWTFGDWLNTTGHNQGTFGIYATATNSAKLKTPDNQSVF
jgi:hypothetical protein